MPHLLHIDSSIRGELSVSRRLTARAAAAWRAAHPGGTVSYRNLGKEPLPHLDEAGGLARMTPVDQHTPEQRRSWELSEELVAEVQRADTVLLGLPLYNYAAPSSVKTWVDLLIVPGLAYDPATGTGLLGDREFIVVTSRGGGYGAGTPREGWDHAESWLPHGLSQTGLQPRFIAAELTLAPVVPAMAELVPLHEESLAAAERAIDELWAATSAAV
ncbi:FMN-dependent NADH-azoreductase [Micromonospora phaseoli]|uniref:FMN dependent NADH:quinone oxidoreductase n=1 Tax=Micromonospora phaseoli TaxID=1144548 RepID=A0A1H6ZGX7_9ACTN|nr:NAD(P)H-dependent oxidoreductase [Micromonospora phaseoli]PZV97242.1 FMN-dependent NADH-azoreductase [Micromonospora phaseoli]GIJ77179.1 FMN-dependent NADH-azoreductase [Micromonospora phaseoli]SEJ51956.1 FMN-dependent NADH-azoreductase [Micromonospora phaseoli]